MSVYIRTSVPVVLFQERFAQMEAAPRAGNHGRFPKDAATRIAERLGWRDKHGCLDSPRVRRALGLRPEQTNAGRIRLRETVGYETALRLCEAMDIDPVDIGL